MNWIKFNIDQNNYDPKSVQDIVTDKYSIIHNELYNDALEKAIKYAKNKYNAYLFKHEKDRSVPENSVIVKYENGFFEYVNLDNYRILQKIKVNDNYLSPPVIVVTNKVLDKTKGMLKYEKFELDLKDYWNSDYEVKYNEKVDTLSSSAEYPYNDIIYYDYVNGKAILENPIENTKSKIRFDEISKNDNLKITNYLIPVINGNK